MTSPSDSSKEQANFIDLDRRVEHVTIIRRYRSIIFSVDHSEYAADAAWRLDYFRLRHSADVEASLRMHRANSVHEWGVFAHENGAGSNPFRRSSLLMVRILVSLSAGAYEERARRETQFFKQTLCTLWTYLGTTNTHGPFLLFFIATRRSTVL